MKNMIIIVQLVLVVFLAQLGIFSETENEKNMASSPGIQLAAAKPGSYRIIKAASNAKASEEAIDFFTQSIDARLMDYEEGKLALTRGTTKEIRSYGQLMMDDQTRMLRDIEISATKENVVFSKKLSTEKKDALETLKGFKGKDFDRKFIRMMKIDHKRDLRKFKKGTRSNDPVVKRISEAYLPIVKIHLDKVKELK